MLPTAMTFVSALGVFCFQPAGPAARVIEALCGELMGAAADRLLDVHLRRKVEQLFAGDLPLNRELREAMCRALHQATLLMVKDLSRELEADADLARHWLKNVQACLHALNALADAYPVEEYPGLQLLQSDIKRQVVQRLGAAVNEHRLTKRNLHGLPVPSNFVSALNEGWVVGGQRREWLVVVNLCFHQSLQQSPGAQSAYQNLIQEIVRTKLNSLVTQQHFDECFHRLYEFLIPEALEPINPSYEARTRRWRPSCAGRRKSSPTRVCSRARSPRGMARPSPYPPFGGSRIGAISFSKAGKN